tara:strand:+ start:798 stop:1640 length:843 start_codon:yes stop_codon:yes gene_type:complete
MKLITQDKGIYIFKKDDQNFIKFCPARGGLITSWVNNSECILYFDEERFLNTSKSIRGGIPILFPICGSLDNQFSLFGADYIDLKQHGFARDIAWQFAVDTKNRLNLMLVSNELTKKYYPFNFKLNIEISIGINSLEFEICIINKSRKRMPVNFGLHPYFNISNFNNVKFINYPRECQNQKNNTLEITEDLLSNISDGVDLLMYSNGEISFKDYGLKRQITLINPKPFDLSVIWSDPPRKMICLEPWTSPRNSFIDGFRNINLLPNQMQKLTASIKVNAL